MISFQNFFQKYYEDNAGDVWTDKPTHLGVLIYSVFTPCICFCGIIMNTLCIMVLSKKLMECSFYIYLLAIASVDLVSCALIFVSGLARGIFWSYSGWIAYDALISIPLGSFLSTMSTIATVSVTIDRVIFLWNPVQLSRPKFCCRRCACIVIVIGAITAFLSAIPYCFIFEFSVEKQILITTQFYHSRTYMLYNWFNLIIFGLIPFFLLSVGNVLMIKSIKRAKRLRSKSGRTNCKIGDQTKITITLVAIVFFYMIGELPAHISSRETATNIVFRGDEEGANASYKLEITRQVVTIVNAFHLTIKFVLYCLFCPPFYREFKATVMNSRKRRKCGMHKESDKLFVISNNNRCKTNGNYFIFQNFDAYRGFMNMFVGVKVREAFPKPI